MCLNFKCRPRDDQQSSTGYTPPPTKKAMIKKKLTPEPVKLNAGEKITGTESLLDTLKLLNKSLKLRMFNYMNREETEAAAGPKMGFGDPRHDRQLSERMFFIEEWKQASLVLDRFVQQFFLKIRLLKKMLVQLKGCSFSCFCYQCR